MDWFPLCGIALVGLVGVPPLFFSAVHSIICMRHEGITIFTIFGIGGDSDAGANLKCVSIEHKWLSNGFQDLMSNLGRSFYPSYVR